MVNVCVVYFVCPVMIVTNFVMEKHRAWLALVDAFSYVGNAQGNINITVWIYFRFESHLGYF